MVLLYDRIHLFYILGNKRRKAPLKAKVMDSIITFRCARVLKDMRDTDPEEYLLSICSHDLFLKSTL